MDRMGKKFPLFYAAFSKDREIIMKSSSGGIFFEICRFVIDCKGVVYGAVQTEASVVQHKRAETLEEAVLFRRSKYLKSRMGNCYDMVKQDLENGRLVLFSGVGCQVDGLKKYLKDQYGNLITCEVICHGAPINSVMEKYLEEKEAVYGKRVVEINWRDKCNGWKNNHITEYYSDGTSRTYGNREHPVHSLYLQGISMEKRCSLCRYADLTRVSDITLGDYWKYEGELKEISRNQGLSLILINSEKGKNIFDKISKEISVEETTEDMALKSCPYLSHPPAAHPNQDAFLMLLEECGFEKAYQVCTSFGDVVLPDRLHIAVSADAEEILDVFYKDTQEVIYITNDKGYLNAIVTYGSFIMNYSRGTDWMNPDFSYVAAQGIDIAAIRNIFQKSDKILRIPVLDAEGKICCEIRRFSGANGKEDKRKQLIPLAKLCHRKIPCLFVQRPDFMPGYAYTKEEQYRIDNGLSFSKMQENPDQYAKEFRDILGEKYSSEYVEKLSRIPGVIRKGNRYQHADSRSELVNVIGGQRITTGSPELYQRVIHIYGRCGVFGYAVEDAQTIPSQIQLFCNRDGRSVRVENYGMWGADEGKFIGDIDLDIESGVIQENDIVIIYATFRPWLTREDMEGMSLSCYDTTEAFHEFLQKGYTFYDIPGHMTAEGYAFIASYIYEKMEVMKLLEPMEEAKTVPRTLKDDSGSENFEEGVRAYLNRVKALLPMEKLFQGRTGAIVMNCNPFTLGHRYLIEKAMQSVDNLLLFVLEEDKSFFKFADRLEMVRQGTADLSKVQVLPSGNYMISALTFPEYFLKEQEADVIIDAAEDVQLFGKYIAPALNITVRFVGTEPIDKVTSQYNFFLKKYLGQYGVELREVSRLKEGAEYVSASLVRALLKAGQYEEIRRYVPSTTYQYLKHQYMGDVCVEKPAESSADIAKAYAEYRQYVEKNRDIKYLVQEIPLHEEGKHKWVGGQIIDDVFYGVPNNADTILSYSLESECVEKSGHLSMQEYKWTGGATFRGKMYMFPRAANSILVLDVKSKQTEEVPLPVSYHGQHHYGGVVTPSGILFQYPIFNTDHILCVNLNNFSCTKVKVFDKENSYLDYRGGILHPNGYIYMFPFSEGRVIRLNPQTLEYRLIGAAMEARCFGAKVASDGNVYGFRRGPGIFKLDADKEHCEIIERQMNADSYGTMLGINGRLYNIPGGAECVWEYDVLSGEAKKIYELSSKEKSKCAGGAVSERGDLYVSPTDINVFLWYQACGEHADIPKDVKRIFYDDFY